ncbi:MAG: integrase core domain-containing protein, partial [Bacteroidota bacterium]
SDPYENALAERMNRTIKEEFGLGRILLDIQQVKALIKEAVKLYNTVRAHLALKMLTREDVYSKIN